MNAWFTTILTNPHDSFVERVGAQDVDVIAA